MILRLCPVPAIVHHRLPGVGGSLTLLVSEPPCLETTSSLRSALEDLAEPGAHRPRQRVLHLRREDRRGSSSFIVHRSDFFFLKQRSSSLRSGLMLLLLLCPCRTAKVGVESTDGTSFSLPESQAVQPSTAAVLLLDSSYFNSILWQNVQRLGKIRAS